MAKHNVGITFTGDVFSLLFRMEGRDVDLRFDGEGSWKRTLAGFDVEGELDYYSIAKAFSQTRCALEITVDGQVVENITEEVSGAGFLEIQGSINV